MNQEQTPGLNSGRDVQESVAQPSGSHAHFRASPASELQDLDIWRIVACLPDTSFEEIKRRILSLSRDRCFAMTYWVKVCKIRAVKGLPMPWDRIH